MGWTAGATKTTGDLITAAIWNSYMGASGSLDYLKASPYFTGTVSAGVANDATVQLKAKSTANDIDGIVIDAPAGLAAPAGQLRIKLDNVNRITADAHSDISSVILTSFNAGNNKDGPFILIGRNSSAGAEGPAAGTIGLCDYAGNYYYLWSDNTHDLRIHSASPTGSAGTPTVADTAGTVVGDQTSWHELKTNIKPWDRLKDCLKAVLDLPLFSFRYKQSSYKEPDGSDREFVGPVIFEKKGPLWYGKNMGPQQTPCLDEVTSIGYLIGAVKELARQVTELKAEIAVLKG